ncbi:MAG: hypothetical protein ACO1N9_13780 [Flavobacterium sp.]
MKAFAAKAAAVFFLLCIVFVPIAFVSGDLQLQATSFLFSKPVLTLQGLLFDDSFTKILFSSDTRSLNILIALLGIIAFPIAFFLKDRFKIVYYAQVIIAYYLAFILLKYGFDKIFLGQFYTPEPNILYTPFGRLSKDILYWSTMGISPVYSVITGSIEVLAALLLIFRRTRALGLLLSLVVMLQIVIVNFSFDISVKTFSLLLFGMVIFAAWPVLKTLYQVFVSGQPQVYRYKSITVKPHLKKRLKAFITGLMLIQIFYLHFTSEDSSELNGAYVVEQVIYNGKPLINVDFPVKRIFFHKDNFIIFQNNHDEMTDYHYKQDTEKQLLVLSDYKGNTHIVSYGFSGNFLVLNFESQNMHITAKPLPWKELPALQDDFHFTIDDLK